jgi:hypothetical protein
MLKRIALERERRFADILIDFTSDLEDDWPDLIEVSAKTASTRVRLRLHLEELELLAVALDNAVMGGDGELYFQPKTAPT